MRGTTEQLQHGGGLILNVIRSHRRSSMYRLSSGVAWVESFGGQIRVASGTVQEVKQGAVSRDKLQNGGDARGRGIDLLLGSVSPLYRESFMSYEILNTNKTNVGERFYFEQLSEKKWGPENFLEAMPLRASEKLLFTRSFRCRLFPSFVLFQVSNLL